MTQNDMEREIYEGRLKAQRDANSRLRGARMQGQLIGHIRFAEKVLNLLPTPEEELLALAFEELEALADQLMRQAIGPEGE